MPLLWQPPHYGPARVGAGVHLFTPEHIAVTDDSSDIETDAVNSANDLARFFVEVSELPPAEVRDVTDAAADGIKQTADRNKVVKTLVSARKLADDEQGQAFAGGSLHATREITSAFGTASIDESTTPTRSKNKCVKLGVALADLDFAGADRILFASQQEFDDELSLGGQAWVDGRQYAMTRAITGFRTRLEQRVIALVHDGLNGNRTASVLAVLLFVAVTGPNRRRVTRSLGPSTEPVLDELDQHRYISCADDTDSPRLKLTKKGLLMVRRLMRGEEYEPEPV